MHVIELEASIENAQPTKTMMESVSESETSGVIIAEVDQLRAELDDIIASDCLLCGEITIQSITTPFFDPIEAESWKV